MRSVLSMANIQGMDTESGQVVANCLNIPLILREIFHCFPTSELIKLSLVNKLWNYEARSLMKQRGNLTAIIGTNQSCQALGDFAADLRRMKETQKIVPFSGMTIWVASAVGDWKPNRRNWRLQCLNGDHEPAYEEILHGLTWKHLSVRILFDAKDLQYCPTFLLAKKVLASFASVLEEFSIETDVDAAAYSTRECLRHCSFSLLKTFRLLNDPDPEYNANGPECTELIKTVVSRAPNLQVFHSTGEVDLHGNLLEGSSALHVVENGHIYRLNSIPESLAGQLRFPEFDLFEFDGLNLERFNSITSKILQSSRIIMTKMGVDVALLAPLMDYGICLENVEEFRLSVDLLNVKKRQCHIWRLVKSFDFTRIFPKLDTVSIINIQHGNSCIRAEFNEMVEQRNAVPTTPAPDRAANIKRLKLPCLPHKVLLRRSSFRLLAQMFPDVQKLSIRSTTSWFPFAHVGDIWMDLKEVDVKLQCPERGTINLDSDFCGIFPEEVAHLREQDEEYLRKVNIVPVMPSIAYLKELRTFTVTYVRGWKPTNEPYCTFSKVSGLIAFQRCPNLTVTLRTGDKGLEQALSHLRPYATVLFEQDIVY